MIEKFPTAFVIDELRCIVCGLCVDACPKDAIRMDTYTHTPSEYNRQGFVYDIPRLLKGPPVTHPSDPWFKRGSSSEPEHVAKEAHTRIGEGLVPLKLGAGPRIEVDKTNPVAVTKFLTLMQKARLVLLDEPMAGMSATEKSAMTELIQRVRQQYAMSFLIVEHI